MGIAVTFLSGPLLDLGPDLVGAAVIFAAVGLLTWHGWWMSRHAHAMRSDVQRRVRSEEHTSELQSRLHLVCRLLLEKKKNIQRGRVTHPKNRSGVNDLGHTLVRHSNP